MRYRYGPNSPQVEQFVKALRAVDAHHWTRIGVYILGGFDVRMELEWAPARDAAIEEVNDALTISQRAPEAKRTVADAFDVAWAANQDEDQEGFCEPIREAAAGYAAAGLVVSDQTAPKRVEALLAPFAE